MDSKQTAARRPQGITLGKDTIRIKRSWAVRLGLALIAVLGLAGYLLVSAALGTGAAQPEGDEPPLRVAGVSAEDDPAIGPADAPVTIVEFSDFRCEYCQRFNNETLNALIAHYGDKIRFVYRDFPSVGGQQAAEAAGCASDQGAYWKYHAALFSDPSAYSSEDQFVTLAQGLSLDTAQFRTCLDTGKYRDEVMKDYTDGRSYGVTGTPTFFINGIRLVGAQPLSVFETIIDQELRGG